MSRSTALLASALAVAIAPATAALAEDRPPSAEERTQIERVLAAEGFTVWEEIELDDGLWEIDDAIAADGRKYDLKLDGAFAIIERDPD